MSDEIEKTCRTCYYNTDEFYTHQSCKIHRKAIFNFDNTCDDWRQRK